MVHNPGFGTATRRAAYVAYDRSLFGPIGGAVSLHETTACWDLFNSALFLRRPSIGGGVTVANPMGEKKNRVDSRVETSQTITDTAQILNLCCHLLCSHTYCTFRSVCS